MYSAEQAHWCACSWNWYSESELGSEWVYLQVLKQQKMSCRQEVTHYRVVNQVTALRLTNELCHKSQQKHRWHTTICAGIINKEITRQALLIEINITGMQVKNRFKWEYFSKVLYDGSFLSSECQNTNENWVENVCQHILCMYFLRLKCMFMFQACNAVNI